MPSEKCKQIKADLAEVQAAYDNKDSIFVVPISTDYLKAMKVIGKALDVNIIMHSQNTLFFLILQLYLTKSDEKSSFC